MLSALRGEGERTSPGQFYKKAHWNPLWRAGGEVAGKRQKPVCGIMKFFKSERLVKAEGATFATSLTVRLS